MEQKQATRIIIVVSFQSMMVSFAYKKRRILTTGRGSEGWRMDNGEWRMNNEE